MAYDVDLADRLRELMSDEPELSEKRMFGGLAFLVAGRMAVAVGGQGGLLLRIDPAQAEALLADPRAEPQVMQGRELAGWLHVNIEADTGDDDLARWIAHGVGYARALPPR